MVESPCWEYGVPKAVELHVFLLATAHFYYRISNQLRKTGLSLDKSMYGQYTEYPLRWCIELDLEGAIECTYGCSSNAPNDAKCAEQQSYYIRKSVCLKFIMSV